MAERGEEAIDLADDLIVRDPEILNGKPIIKGTRISVALILQCVASGMKSDDILKGYPTLTKEGLAAALDFAARQFQGEEIRVFSNHEYRSDNSKHLESS